MSCAPTARRAARRAAVVLWLRELRALRCERREPPTNEAGLGCRAVDAGAEEGQEVEASSGTIANAAALGAGHGDAGAGTSGVTWSSEIKCVDDKTRSALLRYATSWTFAGLLVHGRPAAAHTTLARQLLASLGLLFAPKRARAASSRTAAQPMPRRPTDSEVVVTVAWCKAAPSLTGCA
eukprot:CAMPEP_0115287322 /NCGR_PEP_ID=MMETSP0270-20121206/62395_1 /TAXON_ID=71861 /ORGANISM="Scrippsiella trochoidea, Strain CCMP3099" /LENGTH=179 /DNA_ID=CAMNT_0002704389 /DNA_START=347 /DNA_END=886 /DNA_ORIENTATION=-